MKEIVKVLLQEGIDEETIHEVLDVLEDHRDNVSKNQRMRAEIRFRRHPSELSKSFDIPYSTSKIESDVAQYRVGMHDDKEDISHYRPEYRWSDMSPKARAKETKDRLEQGIKGSTDKYIGPARKSERESTISAAERHFKGDKRKSTKAIKSIYPDFNRRKEVDKSLRKQKG